MKVRSSTRITIAFVLVVAAVFYGHRIYSNWRVSQIKFPPIEPGQVSLLGVDTGAGFKIVVANRMAQLRETSGESFRKGSRSGGDDDRDSRSDSSSRKSRIPVSDMIGALKGDEEKLSKFVMTMNEITDEKLPPERVYWEASDLEKALNGDQQLKDKLIKDLNVQLDGTPLPELRMRSLEDGIVLKLPVPIHVSVNGGSKTMYATVLRPYKPRLMQAVEQRYEDKAVVDTQMRVGYYIEESKKLLASPKDREIVSDTLKGMLDKREVEKLAVAPEHVLSSVQVVVNDSMINAAQYRPYDTPSGKMYDLTVDLTNEGSDRLWRYSKDRVGTQLLLIAGGMAIAAPRIGEELAQRSLEVKQLPDEGLVRDAVDLINRAKGRSASK